MKCFKQMMICIAAIAMFSFVGCTSKSVALANSAKIFYSDSHFIHLVDPHLNAISVEENQHVTGAYGEKKFTAESWMLLNDSTIHMMLFSSMGNTIAELVFTKDTISFESKWMDAEKVKPEYIIADIQFCYYPKEVLEENFRESGFSFAEEKSGEELVRTLSDNGTPILKMVKSGNRVSIENSLRHYSYQIESEKKE